MLKTWTRMVSKGHYKVFAGEDDPAQRYVVGALIGHVFQDDKPGSWFVMRDQTHFRTRREAVAALAADYEKERLKNKETE